MKMNFLNVINNSKLIFPKVKSVVNDGAEGLKLNSDINEYYLQVKNKSLWFKTPFIFGR